MFPDQQNQQGGQPGYGVNSSPQQTNGQYEVLPPLPQGQNNGHTGHNPYEFIVNPVAPKKSSPFSGNNGFLKKIGLIVGGAVLLMIVVAVILSAVAPKSSTTGLIAITQRQQEIIRISTAAATQSTSQNAKNFTSSTEVSVASSQQLLLAYLATHGTKVSTKKLAVDQSSATDTLLSNALTANNYDTAAIQNLDTQLNDYETLVKSAFNQTDNATLKQLLNTSYASARKLVDQADTLSSDRSNL